MATNTTGTHNTANGMGALGTNTGGALNTANGMEALQFNTTGSNNVAVGADAMESNTIGSNNVALGESALRSNTTGSNNIAIGRYADVASSTGSNQLSIGNWIYGTNGNIGVGTNAPTNKFQVNGSSFLGGGSFELRDAGVVDSTAVRLFSAGGNLYLQNGAGDNIVFRGKTGAATMTLSNAGFLNVSGNIRNSNPSVGYLELS